MATLGDDGEDSGNDTPSANAEIIENPLDTISVQAGDPITVGNDGTDPVTAWAMAELSHRQSQAVMLGYNVPQQPYTHLLTGLPESYEQAVNSIPPISQEQNIPITEQAHMTSVRTVKTQPDDIRRANLAYRSVVKNQSNPPSQHGSEPGTISNDGGWFAAAMLDALAKAPPEDRIAKPVSRLDGYSPQTN